MAKREPATSPRRIAALERDVRCLELRRSGMTYDEIARAVGLPSRVRAFEAVKRVLEATVEEPANDVRKFEIGRLERLLRAHWLDALQERQCRRCGGAGEVLDARGKAPRQCAACGGAGVTDRKIRATTAVLGILDRIHRLKGLDEGVPIGDEGEILIAIRRETSWRHRTRDGDDQEKTVVEEKVQVRRPTNGRNGGRKYPQIPSE